MSVDLLTLAKQIGSLVRHALDRRAPDIAYVLVLANTEANGKMSFSTNLAANQGRQIVALLRELACDVESDLDELDSARANGRVQ